MSDPPQVITSSEPPPAADPSRWGRFLGTRYWVALRNVLGWTLILASLVAGPLVPGPGGIPLFLVGFALVSFPGKRRLTARVLRGRPIHVRSGQFAVGALAVSLALPAALLPLARRLSPGLAGFVPADRPVPALAAYLAATAVACAVLGLTPAAINMLLRLAPKVRRRIRPWLRRHRIHLLPPRRRARLRHEPGTGPVSLREEILKFRRRPNRGGTADLDPARRPTAAPGSSGARPCTNRRNG